MGLYLEAVRWGGALALTVKQTGCSAIPRVESSMLFQYSCSVKACCLQRVTALGDSKCDEGCCIRCTCAPDRSMAPLLQRMHWNLEMYWPRNSPSPSAVWRSWQGLPRGAAPHSLQQGLQQGAQDPGFRVTWTWSPRLLITGRS